MRNFVLFARNLLVNRAILLSVFILWLLFQIAWNFYFQYDEWVSDSGLYQYYAKSCYEAGTMYPNEQFYHSEYIHNPGWVNILILWYSLFGSFSNVPILLIFFNIINLFILFKIAKEIAAGTIIPYITVYVYMLLPAFSTTFTFYWSEPAYILFALLSFYFTLKHNIFYLCVAGVCIALAYWIRPVALASIVAGILFILLYHKKMNGFLAYVFGILFTCYVVAYMTRRHFPDYLCAATTGGVNLIMVAHEHATGGWDGSVRKKGGSGYIPNLWSENQNKPVYMFFDSEELIQDYTNRYNYREVDSIYMARSIEWIKNNTWKYLALMPHKMSILFDGSASMWAPAYKGHGYLRNVLVNYQKIMVKTIVFLAFIGLFFPFYRDMRQTYLVLIIIFYTGMSLISVVHSRFNWAFLPLVILFSTIALRYYFHFFTELLATHENSSSKSSC